MVFFADVAVEVGDPALAGPLLDRLAPWADQWSDNGATAANPISHYLGGLSAVLGRYDDANAFFARSAAMCRDVGAQFFLAQTEFQWGRMLARRGRAGDADQARELLQRARDTATERGYTGVRRRAEDAIGLLDAL
jgi:hypothetical protein